jgi:signal transduction histidine kinase
VSEPQSLPGRWHHDLKNQLGIILGFSELLLEEFDPADARRADVEEIHTAVHRALEILARARVAADDEPS